MGALLQVSTHQVGVLLLDPSRGLLDELVPVGQHQRAPRVRLLRGCLHALDQVGKDHLSMCAGGGMRRGK